jgi:SAM-dependent methyltransferase
LRKEAFSAAKGDIMTVQAMSPPNLSDFRCPRCGGCIEASDPGGSLRCVNTHCVYSGTRTFPIVQGQPVLIDFERSVLSEDAFEGYGRARDESESDRGKLLGLARIVQRALAPKNRVAKVNAPRFHSLMKEVRAEPTMLIVGGGTIGKGTEALYADAGLRRWAFDVFPSAVTDFVADGHCIPLPDGCVDGVWVQAVLEHVLDPNRVVAEIHRVLRPNGIVYSEVPFMQQVHEGPYDFTRFSESGHRWLFRWFDRIDSGVVFGPGTSLFWSIRYALAALFRSRRLGTAVTSLLFFWVQFLDRIVPESYAIDGVCGSYFLGRKTDHPLQPSAIVDYYQGAQRQT